MRALSASFALAVVLAVAQPAQAQSCSSVIAGPEFGADASAFAASQPECAEASDGCEATGADGVTTVFTQTADGTRVNFRRRNLVRGETLQFGVLPTDSPDQAMAKVKAARIPALWGKSMDADPASVAARCNDGHANAFMLQFMFDAAGRMTHVSEAWINGRYLYVEDPTLSLRLTR